MIYAGRHSKMTKYYCLRPWGDSSAHQQWFLGNLDCHMCMYSWMNDTYNNFIV